MTDPNAAGGNNPPGNNENAGSNPAAANIPLNNPAGSVAAGSNAQPAAPGS